MDAEARRRAEDRLAQVIYDAMPQQTVGTMRRKTWAEYEDQDTYYRKVARAALDSYVADAVAQAVKERDAELAKAHVCPACGETTIAEDSALVKEQAEEIAHLKASNQVLFKESSDTINGLINERNQQAEEIARLRVTLSFIESAALFHPEQVWPDEMKAQLRRIGKLAAEALRHEPPASGGQAHE